MKNPVPGVVPSTYRPNPPNHNAIILIEIASPRQQTNIAQQSFESCTCRSTTSATGDHTHPASNRPTQRRYRPDQSSGWRGVARTAGSGTIGCRVAPRGGTRGHLLQSDGTGARMLISVNLCARPR